MEIPRFETEVPRYEIAKQIRSNLPQREHRRRADGAHLMVLYQALSPRDRTAIYNMALMLAERSAEEV